MSNGTGMKGKVSRLHWQNKKKYIEKRVRGIIYHCGSATKSTGDVIWSNSTPSHWVWGSRVEMGEVV